MGERHFPKRMLRNDVPPQEAVYQHTQWWLAAGCFEVMVHDLRALLHLASGRLPDPTATVRDSRALRSTQRLAIGPATTAPSAVRVTSATKQDWAQQVGMLVESFQKATGESVELAQVDQSHTGEAAAEEVQTHGLRLEVVKHPESKGASCCYRAGGQWRAQVRWVARSRRSARDSQWLPETVAGLHFVAYACLLLHLSITALGADP